MVINRLINEPYISESFIEKIEKESQDTFNHLLNEIRLSEQPSDPMSFLELLIYREKSEPNYWGLTTILKYKIFFSERDNFQVSLFPNAEMIKYNRNESLARYLSQLDPVKIELKILYFVCEKCLNMPNVEGELRGSRFEKTELLRILSSRKETKTHLDKYLKTNCLDHLLCLVDHFYFT